MIKIFGKIRYHWQPELSISIIYWSVTFSLIFLAMILTLEKTQISSTAFIIFALFLALVSLGFHRYFLLTDKGELKIMAIRPKNRLVIKLSSIEKIQVGSKGIILFIPDYSKGRIFYMRKWHREPFIEALLKAEPNIPIQKISGFSHYVEQHNKIKE
ncbi:MAG: EbsA family protein [Streptococcaceae bacterium]|jgi:hypothetical protein|nr:EbsA family protein [Streptococcaceae bacterium]MCH4177865.1 EbsA family protein [Streptococcaceae bacterium]